MVHLQAISETHPVDEFKLPEIHQIKNISNSTEIQNIIDKLNQILRDSNPSDKIYIEAKRIRQRAYDHKKRINLSGFDFISNCSFYPNL